MSGATILLAGGGSGGHVFPLVAVADALKALAPEVESVFVGTERGMETTFVPARGYRLELVRVVPIRGRGILGALRGIARAVLSIPEARALLRRVRPRAVLSIGGYAAGPVSLAARFAGIPLALIEPNSVMGLANRLIAPLVQRGYTAFAEAERHFRPGAVLAAGVPIRAGFEPVVWKRKGRALQVLVIGGSQGAKALNETVPEALARVKSPLAVVHQCGSAHADAVRSTYERLRPSFAVDVVPFIDDMPGAIARADLVIGRAGASAVSEISAIGRAALYVPYPFAAGDHQLQNARSRERDGAAVCVPSAEASAERIAAEVERLAASDELLFEMAEAAAKRGRPHAAEAIAKDLLALAGLTAPATAARAKSTRGNGDGRSDARLSALARGVRRV